MAAPVTNNSNGNKSKRSNKPMMEKKRRERINKALNSIKEIVLKAQQQDPSKNTKLEKADILEQTLKHLEQLHGNSTNVSPKSEECSRKYKEGFDRCLTQVIKYLCTVKSDENSTVIAAVIEYLNGFSKDASLDIRCHHGNKGESKVRAMIDTSVFSEVMRHEQCVQDRVPSPTYNNNTITTNNNNSSSNNNIFPPSPPDSSRSSSPPDSLRGSPKYFVDYGTTPFGQVLLEPLPTNRQDRLLATHPASRLDRPFVHHRPLVSIPTHRDRLHQTHPSTRPHVDPPFIDTRNNFSPQSVEAEGRPLNLSVSSNSSRRGNSPTQQYHIGVSYSLHRASLSPSTVVVKREAFSPSSECAVPTIQPSVCAGPTIPLSVCAGPRSYSPNSPSGSFQPLEGDRGNLTFHKMGDALPLEARGGPSWRGGHSLRTEGGRPAPYPKKEAVKRYQNRNHFQTDKEAHGGEEANGGEAAHAAEANRGEAQGGESPPIEGGLKPSHWRPW